MSVTMDWFPPPEQWRTAKPPFTTTPAKRMGQSAFERAADLDRVLNQLAFTSAARYRPDKLRTWCNVATKDACEALGCPLPKTYEGRETTANLLFAWFISQASVVNGWTELHLEAAAKQAEDGWPVVVTAHNDKGSGHIMMGRAAREKSSLGLHVAGAGRVCTNFAPVAACFGDLKPRFFSHA